MKKLVLEFNGSLRHITKEQLNILLQHGFVSQDTKLIVEGQELLVRDFVGQTQNDSIPQSNVVPPLSSQKEFSTVASNTDVPPLDESTSPAQPILNVPVPERRASLNEKGVGSSESNNRVLGSNDEVKLISEFKTEVKTVSIIRSIILISCGAILVASGLLALFVLLKSAPNILVERAFKVTENELKPIETDDRFNPSERRQDFDNSVVLPEASDSSDSFEDSEENVISDVTEEDITDEVDSENDNSDFDLRSDKPWFSAETKTSEGVVDEPTDDSNTDDNVYDAGEDEDELDAYTVNSADTDEFDNSPFDDSIDYIAPDFKGCNLIAVYAGLLKTFFVTKGEYESTAEFKKRKADVMRNAFSQNIVGSITPTSRVASIFTTFDQEYDADSRKLICSFEDMPELSNSMQVVVVDEEASYYTGTNALGAEKEIAKAVLVVFGISAKREFKREFAIPVSPSEAKALENRLSALVVFTIDPQKDSRSKQIYATDMFYDRIKPKMSLPFDIDYTGRTVFAKDVEIWFYDDKTGEILLKTPAYRNAKPTYQKRYDSNNQNVSSNDEDGSIAEDDDPFVDETKASNSENHNDEPEDPEVRSQPTWEELLSESVDELANWEKKKPTLTVPGDVATLAEAIEKANSGDVIQLKQSSSAYSLGVKLGSDRKGVVIDKPLAIVGETGDASDVVVKVGVRESIFVESKSVMFKGITFHCGPLGLEKTCEPIISVSGEGSATFKYCSFLGDKVERSVGVQVEGAKAKANFWKCNFQQFGDAGLVAKEKGTATLRYCEFLSQNHYGFSARTDSTVSLERCHFADNEIAFQAETGGGCEIVESRFEQNERRADISAASRNKVEETDNVYDRK